MFIENKYVFNTIECTATMVRLGRGVVTCPPPLPPLPSRSIRSAGGLVLQYLSTMLVERAYPWLVSHVTDPLVLAVFLLTLLVARVSASWWRTRRLPPGPRGVPILGYLPFFSGDAHVHYLELARKYGAAFSIKLGNQYVVVLSDYKMIREAFRKEEFTGRPQSEFSDILGGYGEYKPQSAGSS